MNNHRFRNIQLRAWNKESKKMIYSSEPNLAFIINSTGFNVVSFDETGVMDTSFAEDSNSVIMQGTNFRDKNNTDIYEGDVVFMLRPIKRGLFPAIGVVNSKDFSFSINSGIEHYLMSYTDKNLEVLGNIFENSDAELAAKGEALLKKFPPPKK